jgi:hypothetical protein
MPDIFDAVAPEKDVFDRISPADIFDRVAPRDVFDELPDISPVERNSRIDAGLDFFNRTHPQPEQGPGLEQVDSLAPATPQPATPPPIPPELGPTPARPNTLENAVSGIGEPLEEPPGITPRMESPENLSPLEVLRKGTSMPAPRLSDSEAATLMPPWLAPHVAGVQRSMADFVDFATSPAGIATTLTGGAASVDAVAGRLVSKATASAFALDMAQNLPDQFDAAVSAIQRGDKAEATRAMVNGAAALLMIGHAAKVNAPVGIHPETVPKGPESVSDVSGHGMQSRQSERLPEPAQQPNPAGPDVTAALIDELQGGMRKNQIVRPSGNPFETLPEAKPETPAETPGDIVRKAVEEQPLTKPVLAMDVPRAEDAIVEKLATHGDVAIGEFTWEGIRKVLNLPLDSDVKPFVDAGILKKEFGKGYEFSDRIQKKWIQRTGAGAIDVETVPQEKPPQAVTGVETPGTRETLPSAGESTEARPAQPSGEKTPSPRKLFYLRERSDGVPDILDDIQDLGGIKPPGESAGGEYDGYKEAMRGPAKLLAKNAALHGPDTLIEELHSRGYQRINTPDDLWNAIKSASNDRMKLAATGGGHEAQTERFWNAINDPKNKSGLVKLSVQELHVGDKFRVRGPGISHEELTVTNLDPENGTVQVKDGPKLGAQDIPDGAEIWVKRGSHQRRGSVLREEPPLFGKPESIEEQKAREALEAKRKQEQAQREEIAKRQAKPLIGKQGDIGQKDMFGGGDLFSEEATPEALDRNALHFYGRAFDELSEAQQGAISEAVTGEHPPVQGREQVAAAPRRESSVGREPVQAVELPESERPSSEVQRAGPTAAPQKLTLPAKKLLPGDRIQIEGRDLRVDSVTEHQLKNKRWLRVSLPDDPSKWREIQVAADERYSAVRGAQEAPIERRGPLGGNLSTFGLFDPEAYRPALEALSDRGQMLFRWGDKQREKVLARYRRGDTRNFISRTKDGSDSVSKLMGQRGANIILHELNRSFDVKPEDVHGERSQLREMALTMRIESGGEKSALQEMRYRLTEAKAEGVNLVWKRKALKAIDFAEQHWDKLESAAREYQRLTDAENAFENANGIKTLYRKGGYVFHAQDVDESFGMPSTGQAQEAAGAPAPFRHIRDYQTYAEAIANGVNPVSLNAIDLLQKRLELGQRLIRYGDWADEFQKLTDPHTKQPIAVPPEVRTRADGTEDMTAPAGYQLVHFAGRDFALHNGYAGLFGDLTKPSWMQGTEFRQNVMKTFSGMKHATLLLDTYHMARLAFWNSMTRLGLPTYARGVTILDNTTPELQKMIANGEIPREWGEQLVQRKQVLERMVRQGLNVGSVGDNLYTDFLQNIPGIGPFNKWLFGKYQRGAMAEVALIEHDRQKQMFPDLDDNQLAARVAKDVNTRFGNLQSQSWIKSRTGQDLARIIFLAPQWNESLIRAELGALRQLAAAPGQSFRAGRPAMGALARGVGTAMLGIFIGNQLINMATRGFPTWENPEEEAGSKISAYIPDLLGGPGFFLNPMSVPMEITNLLWRGSERHGGDLTLALRDFAAGRFSGLAKGVWTAMTGYTPMGQPVKGGWDRVGQSVAQALPLPIAGGPVVRAVAQAATGENREKYPGEIQKQAMQSFGVKTEAAPDAQRRMYDLAAKFKQSKGITEPPTREMSFYGDLTSAVKTGNMKAAGEALDKILTLAKGNGEPHTLDDVEKYYRQYPQRTFTNNKSMEGAFKRTLNPEQLRVYNQAVKDRQNIAATVQRLTAERRR